MIYTVGFDKISGTVPVTKETNIDNMSSESIIVVNANGSKREQWEKDRSFPPALQFKGLLPTCEQKEQIYEFVQKGGTVVSTLPDPDEVIETVMFVEEVDDKQTNEFSNKENDGTTIKGTYSPFDWLFNELNDLAHTAYHYKKSEFNKESSIYVESTVETIAFFIGDLGGRVIFTKRLDPLNFIQTNELQEIINRCVKKDEYNVTTR
ncbi:hypothetical protein M3E13_11320 [Oceanobacillus kimchii]|uniref:hypothetical protein n=1 Tax=Oceanobacillus kimchii TaxID=746691 RepID=UPI0021A91AA7|nr:hypothetical protein [Oceanobacillus kimchii]MCT1578443.1 hypothetical protein [Oceanobacillus kimchii]MCT2136508.1 hypothetical protein [Oceanobacillus kimchii]